MIRLFSSIWPNFDNVFDEADRAMRADSRLMNGCFSSSVVEHISSEVPRERDGWYVFDIAVPGVSKNNIVLTVHEGCLQVSTKNQKTNASVTLSLPSDAGEQVKATLDKGLLRVFVEKVDKSTPSGRKIEIEDG